MDETGIKVHNVASGEVSVWIEPNGVICMKRNGPYHDPVELSEEEALEVAFLLINLVKEVQTK